MSGPWTEETPMGTELAKELAALKWLPMARLPAKYAEVFGDPTAGNSRPWLVRRIAWRLQERALGGPSERARARAAELADDADLRVLPPRNGASVTAATPFMVTAPTEMTTDVPEQRHLKNDPKTDWDKRACGPGGRLSSCREENLLNLKGDRYNRENILIHEFNHAIHQQGLREVDPTFDRRLREAYRAAMDAGLWKGTYVATDPGEYWAEGCQAYFNCMRPQFGANTREKLEKYDPGLFKLVDEVYKQSKFRYVRYDQRKPEAGKAGPAKSDK
jgi:hypothetical protein